MKLFKRDFKKMHFMVLCLLKTFIVAAGGEQRSNRRFSLHLRHQRPRRSLAPFCKNTKNKCWLALTEVTYVYHMSYHMCTVCFIIDTLYFLVPGLMSDVPASRFFSNGAEFCCCRGSNSEERTLPKTNLHKCVHEFYFRLSSAEN